MDVAQALLPRLMLGSPHRALEQVNRVPAWLICVGLLLFATAQVSADEPRRVLLLHAFEHAYSPWSEIAASFRADLVKKSPQPIDLYEVSLDTARVKDPKDEGPFIEYVHALLAGRKLDLIVPVGAPAAFFMQRHRAALFPTTPMLIIGADRSRIDRDNLTENDTAALLDLDLSAWIKNILRLRPETTDVAVVVGNSSIERYWASELRRVFQPFADRLHVTWLNNLEFGEMLTHAANMRPQSAIFWLLLSEDAAGVPYTEDRALEMMRAVAAAPIFGIGDYQLGRGIVGGPLLPTQAIGQQAATVALRILGGEPPHGINPPYVQLSAPIYDWRELQRWGISESRLPAGSEVRFREFTLWEQYRWQMAAIFFFIALQAALIGWLLLEHHRRRILEKKLRTRLLEVIHLNRTATAGALSASVAHELNQPLGAIQSYAEAATLYLQADPPDIERAEQILANIRRDNRRAADIISHLRDLLKKRDELEMQECDLNKTVHDALQILRPEALKRGVALDAHEAKSPLPVRADPIHLQQVILNLAVNGMDAMRDFAPGGGEISIHTALADESAIEVRVADSGMGIPTDKLDTIFDSFHTTKRDGTGLGLSIARAIVETHGGKIWAENRPTGGAVFCFRLPYSGCSPHANVDADHSRRR